MICTENDRLVRIETAVQETREKVFNGLSHMPAQIASLQKILIGLLVGVLLGGIGGLGYWIYKMGRVETKLEDHMIWGIEQQRTNEEKFDELENRLLDAIQMDQTR